MSARTIRTSRTARAYEAARMPGAGRRIAARLLVVALGIAVCACGKPPEAAPMEMPPAPVTSVPAVAKDVPVYLDEVGRCIATESVTVTPRVTGSVAKVEVADGADVKLDAALFTIDPRPYEMQLAEERARQTAAEAAVVQARASRASAAARVGTAKSKRDQARAQLAVSEALADAASGEAAAAASDSARATADRARLEALRESGAVSEQDLARVRTDASAAAAKATAAKQRVAAALAQALETKASEMSAEQGIVEAEAGLAEVDAKVASAEADVLQAKAAVDSAALDVTFCSVKAPIAGRAGRRFVDVGTVVTANQTPLLSIQRVDPIYVEFTVTEKDLTAVHGHMGKATLRAEVRLPDASESRDGDVTFFDNTVETGTGTVRMRVTVPNADARFWPGRFARVRLLLTTLPNAILVPAGAPQVSAKGTIVLVLKPLMDPKTGRQVVDRMTQQPVHLADMRPVKVGQRQGDLVVLEGGVQPGERVIVERSFLVFPGAKVIDVPAAPHGSPGGPPGGAPAPTESPSGLRPGGPGGAPPGGDKAPAGEPEKSAAPGAERDGK